MPELTNDPKNGKKAKKPNRAKPALVEPVAREVVYPAIKIEKCLGDQAIAAAHMKKLMGWQKEPEDGSIKFGEDYLYVSKDGRKVRCVHNAGNRPFRVNWMFALAKDILNRNWADSRNGENRTINGETMIVGRTGKILSMQHRGLALIEAVDEWNVHPDKWRTLWPTEPTIEGIIVYGVDESRETVRTLDNTCPRSDADVIATSDYFIGIPTQKRIRLSRQLAWAVKLLWARTGGDLNAYSPYRTRSETVSFVDKHPRLLECVQWLDGKFSDDATFGRKYLPLGAASGLLYLMGCSSSDRGEYEKSGTEKPLDWSCWGRACDFFLELAKGKRGALIEVHAFRRPVDDKEGEFAGYVFTEGEGGGSQRERLAVLCAAWPMFLDGQRIVEGDLKLEYLKDDDGYLLDSMPIIGGIDLGEPKEDDDEEVDDADGEEEVEDSEADAESVVKVKAKRNGKDEVKVTTQDEIAAARKARVSKDGKPPPPKLLKDADVPPAKRKPAVVK